MKKNTLQKALATAMVGAMAMGTLTACGGDAATTGSSAAGSSTESTSTASTSTTSSEAAPSSTTGDTPAAAGMEGWTPFTEKVTLQIPVYDRGDSGNGCSDVENNYWTEWVQKNFGDVYNIDVQYIGITRSAVMNDYSMLAAGKDLPTICMEYDYDKLTDRKSVV